MYARVARHVLKESFPKRKAGTVSFISCMIIIISLTDVPPLSKETGHSICPSTFNSLSEKVCILVVRQGLINYLLLLNIFKKQFSCIRVKSLPLSMHAIILRLFIKAAKYIFWSNPILKFGLSTV